MPGCLRSPLDHSRSASAAGERLRRSRSFANNPGITAYQKACGGFAEDGPLPSIGGKSSRRRGSLVSSDLTQPVAKTRNSLPPPLFVFHSVYTGRSAVGSKESVTSVQASRRIHFIEGCDTEVFWTKPDRRIHHAWNYDGMAACRDGDIGGLGLFNLGNAIMALARNDKDMEGFCRSRPED